MNSTHNTSKTFSYSLFIFYLLTNLLFKADKPAQKFGISALNEQPSRAYNQLTPVEKSTLYFPILCSKCFNPGQIAFIKNIPPGYLDDITIVDGYLHNEEPMELNTDIIDFVWSPEGQKIAFSQSYNSGSLYSFYRIIVIDADRTNQVGIISSVGFNDPFAWSPDGQWIAYTVSYKAWSWLYKSRPDGRDSTLLSKNTDYYHARYPVWSPDGSQIVFLASGGHIDGHLYLVNSDGTNEIPLTQQYVGYPIAWLPDGERLLVEYDPWYNNAIDPDYKLSTFNLNNQQLVPITPPKMGPIFDAALSPDGKRVAFAAGQRDSTEIYWVSTDGSQLTRVTHDSRVDDQPAWSPDGNRIAFTSKKSVEVSTYDIAVANLDGSDLIYRSTAEQTNPKPSWRPSPP